MGDCRFKDPERRRNGYTFELHHWCRVASGGGFTSAKLFQASNHGVATGLFLVSVGLGLLVLGDEVLPISGFLLVSA